MNRIDLPEVILALAPYMEELLRVRKELRELRWTTYKPIPELEKLLEETPLLLYQEPSGLWSFRIRREPGPGTGGTGFDGPVQAFRRAITHLVTLIGQAEAERDEAYRGSE